jgi:hypothetical protein
MIRMNIKDIINNPIIGDWSKVHTTLHFLSMLKIKIALKASKQSHS